MTAPLFILTRRYANHLLEAAREVLHICMPEPVTRLFASRTFSIRSAAAVSPRSHLRSSRILLV
jgi:hypothetical protein